MPIIDRPVSQLELELQAEVDKFVGATAVLGLEKDTAFSCKKFGRYYFHNPNLRKI